MKVDLSDFCDPDVSRKCAYQFSFRGGIAATDGRMAVHHPQGELNLPPVDELWWDELDKPGDWLKVEKLEFVNAKEPLKCTVCYGRGRIGYGVVRCSHPTLGEACNCFLCDDRGWFGGEACDNCNGVGGTTQGTLCWIEGVPFAAGYLRKLEMLGKAEVRLLLGVKATHKYQAEGRHTTDVLAFRTNEGYRGFLMPLEKEQIE